MKNNVEGTTNKKQYVLAGLKLNNLRLNINLRNYPSKKTQKYMYFEDYI